MEVFQLEISFFFKAPTNTHIVPFTFVQILFHNRKKLLAASWRLCVSFRLHISQIVAPLVPTGILFSFSQTVGVFIVVDLTFDSEVGTNVEPA